MYMSIVREISVSQTNDPYLMYTTLRCLMPSPKLNRQKKKNSYFQATELLAVFIFLVDESEFP